jgi:hypothetical protein
VDERRQLGREERPQDDLGLCRTAPNKLSSGHAMFRCDSSRPSRAEIAWRLALAVPVCRVGGEGEDHLKIEDVGFSTTDWSQVPQTEHRGESGRHIGERYLLRLEVAF